MIIINILLAMISILFTIIIFGESNNDIKIFKEKFSFLSSKKFEKFGKISTVIFIVTGLLLGLYFILLSIFIFSSLFYISVFIGVVGLILLTSSIILSYSAYESKLVMNNISNDIVDISYYTYTGMNLLYILSNIYIINFETSYLKILATLLIINSAFFLSYCRNKPAEQPIL